MGAPMGNKNAAGPHNGRGKGRGVHRKSIKRLRAREAKARAWIRRNTSKYNKKRLRSEYSF